MAWQTSYAQSLTYIHNNRTTVGDCCFYAVHRSFYATLQQSCCKKRCFLCGLCRGCVTWIMQGVSGPWLGGHGHSSTVLSQWLGSVVLEHKVLRNNPCRKTVVRQLLARCEIGASLCNIEAEAPAALGAISSNNW
jgi:hypothetical protein